MDHPITRLEIDGHVVLVVPDWRGRMSNISKNGMPANPDAKDLWIVYANGALAERAIPHLERYGAHEPLSRQRQPSFHAIAERIPADVAVYYDASSAVDDDARIKAMLAPPDNVTVTISWERTGYTLSAETLEQGKSRTTTTKISIQGTGPAFVRKLAKAYAELSRTAPSPYAGQTTTSASPILRSLLDLMTAPAFDSFVEWLEGHSAEHPYIEFGSNSFSVSMPIDRLTISRSPHLPRLRCDIIFTKAHLTDLTILVEQLPDTVVNAIRPGDALSSLVALPGADRVRIRGTSRLSKERTEILLEPDGEEIDLTPRDRTSAGPVAEEDIPDVETDVASAMILGTLSRDIQIHAVVEVVATGQFILDRWLPDGCRGRIVHNPHDRTIKFVSDSVTTWRAP